MDVMGNYANLFSLRVKLTQKILLIADYVRESVKEIGRWVEQINEKDHNLPMRVLLVERESGTNGTYFGWIK